MVSKKTKENALNEKKINEVMNRLNREHREEGRWKVNQVAIPSRPGMLGASVKIYVQLLDKSFYCQGITVKFNANTPEWQTAKMHQSNRDSDAFEVILDNIPQDTRIEYYLEMLDKSGMIIQDDNKQKAYAFTIEADGKLTLDKEWDDKYLIPCGACRYMCGKELDNCPICNAPLHDTSQEIFVDDQEAKEEARKMEKEDDSRRWEEAQATSDVWEELPACPHCQHAVQPSWKQCPICGFDLTIVKQ